MESMLKNPELAAELGRNAQDKVQKNFRYSMLASNMVEIYKEIDSDAEGRRGIVMSTTLSRADGERR
jgi:hypothetical protein